MLPILIGGCREMPEPEPTDAAATDTAAEHVADVATLPAVAITVDDLPWVGPLPPGWDRMEGTRRILAALQAHGATAAGFVNCGRVQAGAPVLRQWLAAGHTLGNHTSGHLDLNRADPAEWAEDARDCDRFLQNLTGEDTLFFRYPYLHRGPTPERYEAGRATIDDLGSVAAPVTIDTGDWLLDDPYVAALRDGDQPLAGRIAEEYLDHVVRASRHYRRAAEERFERDVAHILLLHANALLADHLDALLDRLTEEGFRFMSLEEALRDPVYDLEDDYLGPRGLSWLYRIAPASPDAAAWDDQERARLRRYR
jgi:peptidoglycan-N-acetylglucosamine deacetylase